MIRDLLGAMLGPTVVGICMAALSGPAKADDLASLKQQLSQLHRRIGYLEAGARHAAATRSSGAAHGRAMASHEVTVSGFVQTNVIHDLDRNLGAQFDLGRIDIGVDDDPHTLLHARHTRLVLKSRSDTAHGTFSTWIEGDFLGTGGDELFTNSTGFRVRHAWADWQITHASNFGVGQTWSNFMSPFALPPSVDVRGPSGRSFLRQPQIRLTFETGQWLAAVAAENPETDIQSATMAGGAAPAGATCNESSGGNPCGAVDVFPDITGRLVHKTTSAEFQISAVARYLRVDEDAASPGFGGSDGAFGWGLLAAAAVDLGIATARVQATYGDGIGRYGSEYGGSRAAIVRDPASQELETVEAFGLVASLTLQLSARSDVTFAYGRVDFAGDDTLLLQDRSLESVYATWMYRPSAAIQFGAEINWGRRSVLGGGIDDAVRIGFSTWLHF
jgi:hypothetical protein